MRGRSGHGRSGRRRSGRRRSGRRRSNRRGPPPQGRAVRQHDGRFQTAKAEETADRYRYPQGIVGQPGRQQQRNIVLPQKLVALQAAPAADIGIDRYLQRFAGSTLPANQVNDGAAALAADEPGGFGGYFQVGGHRASTGIGTAQGRMAPGKSIRLEGGRPRVRWGQGSGGVCCRPGRRGIRRRCSS